VIRLTLVSNALHLEAARRLRRLQVQGATSGKPWLDLLIWEPRRMRLEPNDRRLWPLRMPVCPLALAALVPLAVAGLVEELRLPHLRNSGRALRGIASRARRLVLLDDGLDQYRERPRAVDPERFPPGTPCWLFSDARAARASWCDRFRCGDLGPFYESKHPPEEALEDRWATLIIDAPGLEGLAERAARLPRPWLLAAHPVREKRSWPLPLGPADGLADQAPEELIRRFSGLIVVGESMVLLAAARLKPSETRLLICLPTGVDANVARLASQLAAADPTISLNRGNEQNLAD
jgi:hypothetical protein